MAMLMVGYDLNRPGQNYPELIEKLRSFGTFWHHLDSTWLVEAELTPMQLVTQLQPFIDSTDELLVIDVTSDTAAWVGFSQKGSDWLTQNL